MSAAGIVERMKIDRHGLRVSEQRRRAEQEQNCGQQDGAKRVDVLQLVEGHAAQAIRRIIAQAMGNEAVRRFVQGDGEEDRENPRRRRVQDHVELHGDLRGYARSRAWRFKSASSTISSVFS
jgi:hypothetical protein